MSLYTINEAILNLTDTNTGEIVDWEAFEALQIARDEKIENIGLYIKNLRADAEALKAEKNSFADKQKRAENKAESLKNYLEKMLDGKKYESTRLNISYRKSSRVEIGELDQLPEEYVKTVTTSSADKVEIAKALKAGAEISGATLVETNNIQIK